MVIIFMFYMLHYKVICGALYNFSLITISFIVGAEKGKRFIVK